MRICTVCSHPEHEAINQSILGGESNRRIATQFGITESAIRRHKPHIPQTMAKAQDAAEAAHADDLLWQVKDLQCRALDILKQAENGGDLKTALTAIREARANLELLAKLSGELQENQTVNIFVNPEWVNIRGIILQVIAPYPEAKAELVRRLGEAQ